MCDVALHALLVCELRMSEVALGGSSMLRMSEVALGGSSTGAASQAAGTLHPTQCHYSVFRSGSSWTVVAFVMLN